MLIKCRSITLPLYILNTSIGTWKKTQCRVRYDLKGKCRFYSSQPFVAQ